MPIGLNNDSNNLGLLTGTIGTDYRNLIKRTTNALTRVASPTSSPSTTNSVHNSSGIGFSYASINVNSRLIITFQLPYHMSFNANSGGYRYGYFRTYMDTASVPTLSTTPPGTSTQINTNEVIIGGAYQDGTGVFMNISWLNHRIEYNPNTLNTLNYYLTFRVDASGGYLTFYTNTSTNYSLYTVEEYL